MRFKWTDGYKYSNPNDPELIQYYQEKGIPFYNCELYDDDGSKIQEISFYDYSTPGEIEDAEKNRYRRPYAYSVSYCNGYSMNRGFCPDPDYRNHYGWRGVKTMTVEDVKRWCEEYLAKIYIIDYDKELQKLQKRKERSDWFVQHGYGRPEEPAHDQEIELD